MDQARVADLISIWQRQAEQGQTVSTEELCRDCPELVPEVNRINVEWERTD